MRPSNSLENKTPPDTYWKLQLVSKIVRLHSSLEPPLVYNQDQMPLANQGSLWPCSCRLALEGKTGKEIPASSRLEFLVKFSANNFTYSDAEDNTSRPLNRGGIADFPLSRTLLAIHQKSWEPSFWEVMDSCFISICNFGSFKNPFATISSLSELYFRSRSCSKKKIYIIALKKHRVIRVTFVAWIVFIPFRWKTN